MKFVTEWTDFVDEATRRDLVVKLSGNRWAEAVNEDRPGGFWMPFGIGGFIGVFCDTAEEVDLILPYYV